MFPFRPSTALHRSASQMILPVHTEEQEIGPGFGGTLPLIKSIRIKGKKEIDKRAKDSQFLESACSPFAVI